jgi:hypothetical protein
VKSGRACSGRLELRQEVVCLYWKCGLVAATSVT